jgi:microcompartment protein CcmK/EutM
MTGDYNYPWDFSINNGVNLTEQANEYQALFSYWNSVSFFKGISIWEWEPYTNAGGSSDTGYTPQNKPAEQIMSSWFGNSAVATPVPPTTSTTHNVAASAQVSAQSISAGAAEIITAIIANKGSGMESGILVDVEIYDANGSKVQQKVFDNESIGAGLSKSYLVSYSPASTGTYKVKVGVFTSGWTQNLAWNDSAATFTAGQAQPIASQHISFSAAATSPSGASGSSLTYASDVTNTGDAISGTLIDFEVYDSSNNRVSQNVASNQSFIVGETKHYSYSYTPTAAGTYRIAIGIFNSDWTKNYLWINSAGTITSGSANTTPPPSPPPPPASYVLDIWWPTSGTAISGVTPFKALVEGLSPSGYSMFWQVDGGVLNSMADSSQDYPHKESLVDVSGWSWKGSGPYTLTFTAKGSNGQVLVTKNVNISITH